LPRESKRSKSIRRDTDGRESERIDPQMTQRNTDGRISGKNDPQIFKIDADEDKTQMK
jgi:hypothetical protein